MNNTDTHNQFIIMDPSSIWMLEISLGLGAILLIHWILSSFIKKAQGKARRSGSGWMQKVDSIVLTPLKILFLSVACYYVLTIVGQRFEMPRLAEAARPFISSIVIVCLSWIALRWKKEFIHTLQYHPKMVSTGLGHTFSKLLSMIICILTVLIILQIFQLDIWPLLAFGGIGAAAVGFAAKDVISNFCGGLMLSITRPFLVGDQIVLPSEHLEGPVEEIGWYLTVVRDKEKRPVYLPNAIFSNAIVINNSRMSHRRILETINVRYADYAKLKTVIGKIKSFLKQHVSVDPTLDPHVFLHTFNDSSMGIHLDVYVLATQLGEYLAVKEEVLFGIYDILESEGVKMPFPTFSVEGIQKI